MAVEPRKMPRGQTVAARLFGGVVGLFAFCVLVQVFLAGDAALLTPEMWQTHMAWVHIFQWISVVLPIMAYFGSRRIGFGLLNCVPMVIIGVQYSLIHIGINRGQTSFVGLHAAAGVLLFGMLVFIAQEWRYRAAILSRQA